MSDRRHPHERALEFLADHPGCLVEYAGQWVAMDGDLVVAHAPSMSEAMDNARAAGCVDPLLVPVHKTGTVIVHD